MPTSDPLTAARKHNLRATQELRSRDSCIRQARDRGASLREIASAVGLSPQAVKNICDRVTG